MHHKSSDSCLEIILPLPDFVINMKKKKKEKKNALRKHVQEI